LPQRSLHCGGAFFIGAERRPVRIVEALRGRDTVIMIDEADYLSDSSLFLGAPHHQ
jgi:hypothetical protein